MGDRTPKPVSKATPRTWREVRYFVVPGGIFAALLLLWSYWPTMVEMANTWNREPDYSHGILIPFIALYLLWARRDKFPGWTTTVVWPGIVLIIFSLCLRYFAARWFLGGVDGWSFIFCLAGTVWIFVGTRVFLWALPAIAFLIFMVPMPYRVDHGLSVTLQGIATNLSCWALQILGQPALAEGNTIWLGDIQLGVEQACSGLRIFLGIIAIAFAYVIVADRTWWEKALLLVAVIPIALFANATRIVTTALLYQYVSGEAARKFSHDFAGWVTIPLAALLFALLLWYLQIAFRKMEVVDPTKQLLAAKTRAT